MVPVPATRRPFPIRLPRLRWIILAALAGFEALLCLAVWDMNRVETAENVAHVSWLPETATNVSYYRSYIFTAYEFDMSDEAFLNWAKCCEIKPIVKPFWIPRYTGGAPREPPEENASDEQFQRFWEKDRLRSATINNGYFYQQEFGQSGGFVRVAWDGTMNRAYFQTNPR
jgi:hypothetical protein